MKPSIAIVRHGAYDGRDNLSPLSKEGRRQICSVRNIVSRHFRDICRENSVVVQPLAFSFSSTARALESMSLLKEEEDMVVMELFLPERGGIWEPEKIVKKVFALLAYYGANVATIVAHGDMPAVFAETLIKMARGQTEQLRSPGNAEGYLVDMSTGAMIMLSPEKVQETVPQAATPAPIPHHNEDAGDDDIPF